MSQTTNPAPAPAPPRREDSRPIREVARLDDLMSNAQFKQALARAVPSTLTPARVLSTFAGALRRSPELRQCNVLDVAGKVLFLANCGLEPDSPLQHAHLIPFKERWRNPQTNRWEDRYVCQVVINYHGLAELAFRSGHVAAIRAEVVWRDEEDAGLFSFEYGSEQHLKHKKLGRTHVIDPIAQANGTAEFPTWAYSYVTVRNTSQISFEVIPWSDVRATRDASPAYLAARHFMEESKEKGNNLPPIWMKAPWVASVVPMAAKTAFRRLSNWIPRSVELSAAIAIDAASDSRTIDFGPIVDLDTASYAEAAVDAAGESGDPATTFGDRRPTATEDAHKPTPNTQTSSQRAPAPRKAPAKAASPPAAEPDGPPDDRWGPGPGDEAAPPPAPAAPPAPPPPVAFEEWLLDSAGDTIGDEPFGDPAAFVSAYSAELERAFPPDVAAFVEHNGGALENAFQAQPDLRLRVAGLKDTAEAPGVINVTLGMDRGRAMVGPYLKAFKEEASRLVAGNLLDFVDLNRQTLATLPLSTLALCLKALAEKAKETGVTLPADLAQLMQSRDGPAEPPAASATPAPSMAPGNTPPEDPDWQTARNRLRDIADMDLHALENYAVGIIMTNFGARLVREGKTDVIALLKDGFDARRASLRPPRPA